MKYTDYNMKEHGFVGHLVEPDGNSDKAVIVIMGGEKSILKGVKIAERFADFGITAISVSLFGGEGLNDNIDRIEVDMFEPVIEVLKSKNIKSISTYGVSMGSIFAMLIAIYIGNIDNVILCSPSHVPFESTAKDKKHMLGHSMATWRGEEIPYIKQDFSCGKMMKYVYDEDARRKVTRMWTKYNEAYKNKELEKSASISPQKSNARILLIAGTADEAWPSDYSVKYIKKQLDDCNYDKEYKMILYKNASHLLGVMPNKERNKWLYRAMPIIGLMYKSISKNKEDCMLALEQSEQEVINWINN